MLGNDGAVYQAGWNVLVNSGARVINNSWGIGITDRFDKGGRDPAFPHFTVQDAQVQDQIRQILGTRPGGAYQGAIDAARSGVVTLFAAGNDYNLNNPDAMAGLGYFVPEIAPNWLTVAALQTNPDPAAAATTPYTLSTFSSRCGYTASFCVSAPGTRIYSSVLNGTSLEDLTVGWANKNGTSMERFPVHDRRASGRRIENHRHRSRRTRRRRAVRLGDDQPRQSRQRSEHVRHRGRHSCRIPHQRRVRRQPVRG